MAEDSANLEARDNGDRRVYRDEEKYIALAAVDLNGGNVYRTALALKIPPRTLQDWVDGRSRKQLEHAQAFADGRREKRGDLALKTESVAHSIIESISPDVIEKATLSQRAVAFGIFTDKTRMLRGQGLEPDPASELCRLLGINKAQLPPTLELGPGEEIPAEFAGTLIETKPSPDNPDSFEPVVTPEPQPEPDESQTLMDSDDDDKPAN